MTSQGRNHLSSNDPDFGSDSSVFLSKSNRMALTNDSISPQYRTKNLAVQTPSQMDKQQSLSSPPSAKSLRSRRMLEELVAENSRLRAEVEKVRSQQAAAHEKMVTDLVQTKSELRVKQIQTSDQQQIIQGHLTEIGRLQTDANNALAEFQNLRLARMDDPKLATLQQEVSQLTAEIREKDLNLREKDQVLREREFDIRTMKSQLEVQTIAKDRDLTQRTREDSHLETERARTDSLQAEIQSLKSAHGAALSQLENEKALAQQYRDELSQSQAVRDAAQLARTNEQMRSEQYLREIEQHIAACGQLRSQLEAQETRNQRLTQELNTVQASSQRGSAELRDQMQVLEQLERDHANDVTEARQAMNFFKKNSEATTRKVKGLEAEVKSLMQSLGNNSEGELVAGNRKSIVPQGGMFEFHGAPGGWPRA